MRRVLFSCVFAGLFFGAQARADDLASKPVQPGLKDLSVKAMQAMPFDGAPVAVELNNVPGLIFMSPNGRWVWKGKLLDTWNGKEVTSIDQLKADSVSVDVSRLMGPQLDKDLEPFVVGTGPKKVQIFVDPQCKVCAGLYQEITPLTGQYTFELLVVAMLGQDSIKASHELACAKDKQAALAALVNKTPTNALAQKATCDYTALQKRSVTGRMMHVTEVPYLIAPDGRVSRGRPRDLKAFLARG